MSGQFAEAAAALQGAKDKVEEALSAQRGVAELIRQAHEQTAGVYAGSDAGHDVLNAIDLADNESDEVMEVLQRALDGLNEAVARALSGNA